MSYSAKYSTLVLAIFAMIGLSSPMAQAADANIDKLKKELEILSKIIKTSFGEDEDHWRRSKPRNTLAPRRIQSLYLHGQGVVLNIQVSMGGMDDFRFNFNFDGLAPSFELPDVSFAPLAPRIWSYDDDHEATTEEEMEAMAEMQSAVEELTEAAAGAIGDAAEMFSDHDSYPSKEAREQMYKLREEQRDQIRVIRKKSLETRKLLRKKGKLSEEERDRISAELERYKSQLQEATQFYLNKVNDLQKKQEENWNLKLATFESTLLSVLCEYGGSLRGLPDDQYVSVVLEKANRSSDGKVQDRVFVFKKTDLLACRDGRISLENLKAKAAPYSF